MKLRSAQFVLLVLLFTSLSLSEGSTLRLANDFMAQAAVSARTPDAHGAARSASGCANGRHRGVSQAAPVSALAVSNQPWTMRAPAAHAVLVATVSSLAPVVAA